MIELFPPIIGLNIEKNIKPKIYLLDRIIWNQEMDRKLFYNAPEIFGTKIDKTWIILRWLKDLGILNMSIISKYK